jgi:diaminopimelate decarboxylase
VVAVKTPGRRRFVVVDGGMTDNPRPLLYGARHHPADLIARRQPATRRPGDAGRALVRERRDRRYVLPATSGPAI